MLIRPATPADVPAVLPMVAALCAMHERMDPARYGVVPGVAVRYATWLPQRAADLRSVFLVAEEPGTPEPGADAGQALAGHDARNMIAGFLVGSVEKSIPIYRLAEFGFIHDMWVEPPFRRRGVARLLVEEAVRRFAAMGVSQVRLETADANDSARRLFAACGFRVGTVDMLRETGD